MINFSVVYYKRNENKTEVKLLGKYFTSYWKMWKPELYSV